MRILLYEPIPDINRALFFKRLCCYLKDCGHEVYCLLDKRVRCRLDGGQGEYGIINCLGPLAELVRVNRDATYVYCPKDCELTSAFSERRRSKYRDYLNALAPDKILIWNGLDEFHQDFIQIVDDLNFREQLYFLELGWLPQRDFFYCDPYGVNGDSSISRKSFFNPLTQEQKEQLQNSLEIIRNGRDFSQKSNMVLVPLQIESDTSVQCFSPYKTNQSFVSMLERWIPVGYDVVIRPHPLSIAECPKFNRSDFRADATSSLHDCFAAARFVIGLNSTTLIEALVYNCHVMAFGKGISSSLKGGQYTEEDSFGAKGLTDEDVAAFLYELLFRRQISTHTMGGIEDHLGLVTLSSKPCNQVELSKKFPKYSFDNLCLGLLRFWGGRLLKRAGLIS